MAKKKPWAMDGFEIVEDSCRIIESWGAGEFDNTYTTIRVDKAGYVNYSYGWSGVVYRSIIRPPGHGGDNWAMPNWMNSHRGQYEVYATGSGVMAVEPGYYYWGQYTSFSVKSTMRLKKLP